MTVKSATRSTIENNIFYRSMLAGNTGFVPEDEFLLEEVVLASSQASVTFDVSSYAGTYRNLQIRVVARVSDNEGGSGDAGKLRFNGDTGNNYARHELYGNGSSVSSAAGSSVSFMYLQRFTDAGSTANAFGAIVIDLLDVFETTKYKTMRQLGGNPANSNYIFLDSGLWMNTAAVTSITLEPNVGTSFVANSRFSIYGEI